MYGHERAIVIVIANVIAAIVLIKFLIMNFCIFTLC